MDAPAHGRTRVLGRSGLEVSAVGLGANRWRQGVNDAAAFETFQALVEAGPAFIDTAEIYSFGKSERLIGDCARKDGRGVMIASEFAPFVGRTSVRQMLAALDASLARLGRASLDLYYVHFPFPFIDLRVFAEGLIQAARSGKARAVGVSNFSADQMRRMVDLLGAAGVILAANEVHYSLAHRQPEADGVLQACEELDVALVAYFPLASARLTAEAGGEGALAPLQRVLAEVGRAHQASAAQAALNWLLARDPRVIPIPGATKARHARDNRAALSWRLTDEEFAAIDAASSPRAKNERG
jgi:aryl-alcohol dehydrogenase-like predicted oxidoreductase